METRRDIFARADCLRPKYPAAIRLQSWPAHVRHNGNGSGEARFMIPLLQFIVWLIDLYIFVVFISVILSWLIVLDIVNRRNRIVYLIADAF